MRKNPQRLPLCVNPPLSSISQELFPRGLYCISRSSQELSDPLSSPQVFGCIPPAPSKVPVRS